MYFLLKDENVSHTYKKYPNAHPFLNMRMKHHFIITFYHFPLIKRHKYPVCFNFNQAGFYSNVKGRKKEKLKNLATNAHNNFKKTILLIKYFISNVNLIFYAVIHLESDILKNNALLFVSFLQELLIFQMFKNSQAHSK